MEGKSIPSTRFPLKHLSLADLYWQFRLRFLRNSFISRPTSNVHFSPLVKQIMIDMHPVFGAYILYVCALKVRLDRNFVGAVDHIQFAMEWLQHLRVKGAHWDLAQRVVPFRAA
jgi:hypothetical protein